jgi:hypothetical protein
MKRFVKYTALSAGMVFAGTLFVACSSVQEQAASKPAAPVAATAKNDAARGDTAKAAKTKVVDVQGVISSVGQRTITFQMERKGKVREEVVGVDDKTQIEKKGANVKLRDLEPTDEAMIKYEPDAYTPAIAIKVTGKGKIRKAGGDD